MADKETFNDRVFENVWYARRQYAEGHLKFIVYEQIGQLKISAETNGYSIVFDIDDKVIFETNSVTRVYRRRQGFPFLSYGFVIAIYLLAGLVGGKLGLMYVLFMILISLPLGLLVYFTQTWVVIEYKANDTEMRQYLYDGNYKGWAGRFGGNTKIFNAIKLATRL